MTLTIEIDTLRGLNKVLHGYGVDRADLINLAEYVAGEIARARIETGEAAQFPDASYSPAISAPKIENMPVSALQPFQALTPAENDPAPTQVDPVIEQPEPAKSPPETRVAPLETSRSEPPAEPKPLRKDAWTDEQDGKLIQMKRGGCSIDAMAKQVGRSATAVLARLQKLKTENPGACALGRVWTESEDATLVRMLRDNKSWDEIAAKIDRTVRSVQQRHTKLKKQGPLDVQDVKEDPAPITESKKPQAPPPAAKAAPDTVRIKNLGDLTTLKLRQRMLVMHLSNLNDDFAPVDDLDIVEGLMAGKKPTAIADELGCKPHDVTARWKAMLIDEVVNHQGNPTLDGQQDILVAARHLVKCAEGSNA